MYYGASVKNNISRAPDADPSRMPAPISTVQCLGDKRAVGALAGGMSVRWVDGEMAKGMPHLNLGPRRARFDLVEVAQWLKERYGVQRIGPATRKPDELSPQKA